MHLSISILALLLLVPAALAGVDQQTAGPKSPADQPKWLANLKADREATLKRIGFKGGVFDTPELQWTQTSYIQPQMHPYDQFFYDRETRQYTVEKYLQDVTKRYGGIDAMLLWPTYTNIGVDDRNQFDLFRAMPGGLQAVANITSQLHDAGVKVLWPYNPWDLYTRREPVSDEATYGKLLKQTGGDGFNGDTMGFVPETFWAAAMNVSHPEAFEPEGGGTDDSLNWSTMGWGYYGYPQVPQVDRFKFITRGRFMTNICDRWAQDKTDNLQTAWFNGQGYESWENVWGTWNGITPRDGEAIRRVATMLRFFGSDEGGRCLRSPDWEPHTTAVIKDKVYGGEFPSESAPGLTVWTLVNRNDANTTGQQLVVVPQSPASEFYDCYHGVPLTLEPVSPSPAPADTPGYNYFAGANCYSGAGGVNMDGNAPFTGLSVAQCIAKCDGDEACGCVTYQAGQCWRRSSCQPAKFEYGTEYSTYSKAKGYSTYSSSNSYDGHGGVEIDSDKSAPTGLSQAACKARCDADQKCSCVTFKPSSGTCWKRGSCEPTAFASQPSFETFVNEARVPAPPAPAPLPNGAKAVSFDIEAGGFGCVVESPGPANASLAGLLNTMKGLTEQPLSALDGTWRYLTQTMVDIKKTEPASSAPPGMLKVPAGDFHFKVKGVEIEGDDAHGVDVQYPWEPHPNREHDHQMQLDAFYIDKHPVTTTNYSAYLKASGYKPATGHEYRWLLNWDGKGEPPAALADVPVTYVSLNEARLYCAWANGGSRLPHSYEWQYAAQGTCTDCKYPWGNNKDQSKYPTLTSGNRFPGAEPIGHYSPAADSPFGVADMVGNVWQYTDEFQDAHTRGVLLRGGSNYRPTGSNWYFPQALELNTHNKYFLMDDTYERAGTIGFRCAKDAK